MVSHGNLGKGKLAYDNHSSRTYAQTNDQPAHCHLSYCVRSCLNDASNEKEDTTSVDTKLAPKFVGRQPSNQCSNKSTTRSYRSDKLLLLGTKLVAEIIVQVDKHSRNYSGIVAWLTLISMDHHIVISQVSKSLRVLTKKEATHCHCEYNHPYCPRWLGIVYGVVESFLDVALPYIFDM